MMSYRDKYHCNAISFTRIRRHLLNWWKGRQICPECGGHRIKSEIGCVDKCEDCSYFWGD